MLHLRSQQLGLMPPSARLECSARGILLPFAAALALTFTLSVPPMCRARLQWGYPCTMCVCHHLLQ
jgi:hypothetical protein